MTYIIDKNIPFPNGNTAPNTKYPFSQMKIGDSFLAKEKKAVVAASVWSKNKKRRFISRKEKDGWRIWRIK